MPSRGVGVRRDISTLLLALVLGVFLIGCGPDQPGAVPSVAATVAPPVLPTVPGMAPTVIPTEAPFTGYLAPDFTLPDLAGHPISLHDYRGHPVWLNLWATWCLPCQAEMPEMAKLYAQYKSQGLVILGVDVQEDADRVAKFVTAGGFGWQFVRDGDGAVGRRYYMTGIPMHVFIDKTGAIRGLQSGGLDPAGMQTFLSRILN